MSFKKRRGLGQIMGALLMLAIVVPIGSVILLNGVSEISAFNNSMSNTVDHRNNGIQEDLVFEHIRFEPNTDMVTISVMNTGSVELLIDRITLVNMTNQDLLYSIDLSNFDPISLSIKNSTDITIDADLSALPLPRWDAGFTPTAFEYKISIITSRGNFFDTIARPYNT
jgi:hypothetical protein